jgi:hypothetical protein
LTLFQFFQLIRIQNKITRINLSVKIFPSFFLLRAINKIIYFKLVPVMVSRQNVILIKRFTTKLDTVVIVTIVMVTRVARTVKSANLDFTGAKMKTHALTVNVITLVRRVFNVIRRASASVDQEW